VRVVGDGGWGSNNTATCTMLAGEACFVSAKHAPAQSARLCPWSWDLLVYGDDKVDIMVQVPADSPWNSHSAWPSLKYCNGGDGVCSHAVVHCL
jgi:hypothetical protein